MKSLLPFGFLLAFFIADIFCIAQVQGQGQTPQQPLNKTRDSNRTKSPNVITIIPTEKTSDGTGYNGNGNSSDAGDDRTVYREFDPHNPNYENKNALNNHDVKWIYSTVDSTGQRTYWASFDNPSELGKFKSLGFGMILLLFSIYLFHISTKIYRQYFETRASEDTFTAIFYGFSSTRSPL